MRQIKFRAWDGKRIRTEDEFYIRYGVAYRFFDFDDPEKTDWILMQFTGLHDKNGRGQVELFEGDVIGEFGEIKGNVHEIKEADKRETDLIIPRLGTKAWETAYKEALGRGYDYSE